MSKARDRKRAAKMQELQMLRMLMELQDQFGPKKQLDQDYLEQQVIGLRNANQDFQSQAPLRQRESLARILGLETDVGYAQKRNPLSLADLQSSTRAREIDNSFNEQTVEARKRAITAGASMAELQRQGLKATLPYVGEAAFLDNAMKKHQSTMAPIQQQGARLQNQGMQQQLQFDQDMQPQRLQQARLQQAEAMSQIGMSQGNPQMFDIPAYLKGGGLNVPQGFAPPQAGSSEEAARQLDKQLGAGFIPQQDYSREGQQLRQGFYGQDIPNLLQSMQAQPNAPWSPQSMAFQEVNNNPQAYGQAVPDFGNLPEAQLRAALEAVYARTGQQPNQQAMMQARIPMMLNQALPSNLRQPMTVAKKLF